MKRIFITFLVALTVGVFIAPGISSAVPPPLPPTTASVADYPAGNFANGIVRSRHNLGQFGIVITTKSTTQVCIFCHTPHHSQTGTSPLWNRSTAQSVNYTAYGTTIAGTTVNNANLGGSTLACLSCHDGQTTFDSLVNAPGKGGVVPGGDLTKNWVFSMPTRNVPFVAQSAGYDHFGRPGEGAPNPFGCNGCHTLTGAFATADTVLALSLGFDLTNDHPVSVPYSGTSKASLREIGTTISQINLSAGLSNTTSYFSNLQQNRWAVSGFISSTATISDLLRNNQVECASCHDPHFRNLSYDEADSTYIYANSPGLHSTTQWWCGGGVGNGEDCSDGLFLRRVGGNTGSGVCRTCHNK